MVNAIRNIENALGDGVKRPSSSGLVNKSVARKSIVAARNILMRWQIEEIPRICLVKKTSSKEFLS